MSSSSADPSAEERELSLVSKVEMRIALADSEAKLEGLLKTYLAPLLLKLASDSVKVRNKVGMFVSVPLSHCCSSWDVNINRLIKC